MIKKYFPLLIFIALVIISFAFNESNNSDKYLSAYHKKLDNFKSGQQALLACIEKADLNSETDIEKIKKQIRAARIELKAMDFWFRYLEPLAYKKINGPLPVEWETEVFEKFEKPYKREGAGLTLASLYLDEENKSKDSLLSLIKLSVDATEPYGADSITNELKTYHHFYLCNRLFLLNLAAIYTTGFECPESEQIVPELRSILESINNTYLSFNTSFPNNALSSEYMKLYEQAVSFVKTEPLDYTQFDHFRFIRDYVNPLFKLNQELINKYHVVTKSLVDYSLNKSEISIFNKGLYNGQNPKGIFLRVKDEAALAEIDRLGKMLFYDPILSGNNMRSCASCHKPTEFFTDTVATTSLQFNQKDFLPRNSPSLLNAEYNHLIMMDGKHISLLNQTKAVITNPVELGSNEKEILQKVLSCKEYSKGFKSLLKYTPQETEITFEHIASALTYYYCKFSRYYSPFDEAMNEHKAIDASAIQGFNLFMGKAQCATCHFAPQFNGVKPPYIGSEFEVLGVPQDTNFKQLSPDKGRHEVNPAYETMNAFRTGTIRNAAHTAPYMHNGVFKTLEQVIDFYDAGGGAGRGLKVENQTLSSDSLKLTKTEKAQLISFIKSLNENIAFEAPPQKLPKSKIKALNTRKVGGVY